MPAPLKLYLKPSCPWCVRAKDVLDSRGYRYEEVNVLGEAGAFGEMVRLSKQQFVPVLVAGEKLLADFGPEELETFLAENGIQP